MTFALVLLLFALVFIYFMTQVIKKNAAAKARHEKASKRITLKELHFHIGKLIEGSMDGDFFGISFDAGDSLYFSCHDKKVNLSYEVKTLKEKPFAEKIVAFANAHQYPVVETSYENKGEYDELAQVPVYELAINADQEKATEVGIAIMTEIFGKNCNTVFLLVP